MKKMKEIIVDLYSNQLDHSECQNKIHKKYYDKYCLLECK